MVELRNGWGGLGAASGGAEEQGRRRLVGEVGLHRAVQIVEDALAVLGAGGECGPDALEPLAAGLRLPWVTRRLMTTKRIACSARLLVGSTPGVVMNRKYSRPC